MRITNEKLFEATGWGIFVASALLYTWSGLRAGDVLATLASLLFLAACFVFLTPMVIRQLRPLRKLKSKLLS